MSEDKQDFVDRLVIIQESGMQFYTGRYESYIHRFIPFNDATFGKQYCARLNRETGLPYYLASVKVKITSSMEKWTDERLVENNIPPLPIEDKSDDDEI